MDSQNQCKPIRLFYETSIPVTQDPQLSPIILLHGIGTSHATWNRVNTKIANKTRRKVFSLDLRNHGQSEWTKDNSLLHLEADIENFLSENGIKKCILIGHSLGGRVAMFLTLRKPHLVEKIITEEMVLANPSPEKLAEATNLMAAVNKIHMLPKGLDEVDVRNLFSRLIAEKYPHHNDFAFCMPLKKSCDGSFQFDFNFDAIEKTYKDTTAYQIDFKECQMFYGPALVMLSKKSPLEVEQDEKIKEFFPNAEFRKFETSTHVLHADKPDEFITTVSDFINK